MKFNLKFHSHFTQLTAVLIFRNGLLFNLVNCNLIYRTHKKITKTYPNSNVLITFLLKKVIDVNVIRLKTLSTI